MTGLGSDPAFQAGGVPVFDNSTVYYDGNSQGGILGGALMGVIQDVTRGCAGRARHVLQHAAAAQY